MQLQHTPEVTGVAADSRPSKTSRADDSSAELERLRDELKRVRDRAEKLLEVTTALSEANSVEDVTRVFLTKGLAVVEASRGVLVSVEGDRLRILGTRGMPPQLEAKLDVLTLASEIPIVHALRSGKMISIESADDFRRLYAGAFEGFAELADMETYLATPLIHAGETIGAIALHFSEAKALGAADRAFTLVLAQTTATALYRAKSYDAEREKRKNAELESHAREEVLGVVAHDLRNPLSLIVTTTELLKEEELEPARRDQILDIAMRAGKQMNRLIDDLLDTVHIESGKFVLSLEDTEVCAILRQAEETFRPIAERRQVKFTRSSPDGEIWVRADPFRVSQVIGNLIGNALKFTPENGSVTYGAVVSGSDIEFRVTDTGPGISPEQQQHLFEEFWQARKADRRGVGLGLTIARGIVDAHGGRIWCDSAPGKGSTFSFTLPALNRVAEPAAT